MAARIEWEADAARDVTDTLGSHALDVRSVSVSFSPLFFDCDATLVVANVIATRAELFALVLSIRDALARLSIALPPRASGRSPHAAGKSVSTRVA
jgi:hypothetical protein